MIGPGDNYPPGVTGNEPEIAGYDADKCRQCDRSVFVGCECERCEDCDELTEDCECEQETI